MRLLLLSGALACAFASSAFAEELTVYAAAGVKAPFLTLAAGFEKATGHRIDVVFDTAGATNTRFLSDPAATLLITTDALIAEGEKNGRLTDGVSYRLGDTVAGLAAPPGSVKPDISTVEKLKTALLSARRIAFSDPARGATVGTHFMKMIESMGVRDEVLEKATLAQDGVETMRLVLEGTVDLGVTQTSEIVQANRAALVGPFPKEFDLATTYSLWHRAGASAAVKDFAALLTGATGRAALAEEGLRTAAAR
ncbi:MAG: substrate-binding domain-containing protein [Acidobacteria bacterium]|nr:substrate-binding domain-containing protein [Acidobacteriota bacterium]